ncbi:MAG: MotA/TolQ/ExbB proton channel family protein [Leptolyngbya sp. PLA2]|nr:MotA/TolQ/ExbB proton channel family protein [Leptolyngbya sp. PL-A2]MCQ3941002.1 hypothetical protein [cyanobacterium CYA1]MCZ7633124.1 MotA/TolQ/ExbB proton channel family protein [Phycisphaerales bacterium]MDL1905595.1 MotA/TolQ/ExbB proton channel family protein [Synechococcales cyanobacterium CNB]
MILTTIVPGVLTLAQNAATDKSLMDYISQGRQVGFLIIALSFVAVVLIIAQVVRLRMKHLAPAVHVARLHEMLRANDTEGTIAYCTAEENASFLTRVFGSALLRCRRSAFGFLELRSALEEAGQQEVSKLQRSTESIGLIATVAPMLGLLGTVVGMVGAFDTLSTSEGVARPDELAGDISVALITTVMGLIVAIPCTAAYAWLRNRIDAMAQEIARIIDDLASHLESAGASAPGSPGGSQAGAKPAPRPRTGVGTA